MNIQNIETFQIAIPLHKPFKTALRTVTVAESVVVKVTCDNGVVGYGEAPPTHVITGDSLPSINYAITKIFKPLLLGESLRNREQVFERLYKSAVGNTSAKAAVDMAIYDCVAQQASMPLSEFLGGYSSTIETDYTVSVNEPDEMADDAQQYIHDGFSILKVKVGKDKIEKDIERIKAIRKRIGGHALIRLDANQGWHAKEAVRAIQKMEDLGLDVELVEQPVKAHDVEGLKYVTENTQTPIMADESVFSIHDAKRVLENGAADLINIKLMKAGGIHEALRIAKLAHIYGVECMVGSMIETKIGITAAAHFAASQPNVNRYDFDAPLMLAEDLIEGGITYKESDIELGVGTGLGIEKINDKFIVD
ncbi:mandelate racemase/muconate lactonizing enzyme family protein [Virgibacillus litoralis]|uniref:Dipeptide epimerase n=1 Tax=Virgibacillus litoralis TaxID=578221 RepID=A0ABS4HD45_9BACI|nr:dipeptide epimerase [Virgibacillus litoralis]MBP1948840.1 o-succinylbenzoate synthase [Virgibacillus litoralis]